MDTFTTGASRVHKFFLNSISLTLLQFTHSSWNSSINLYFTREYDALIYVEVYFSQVFNLFQFKYLIPSSRVKIRLAILMKKKDFLYFALFCNQLIYFVCIFWWLPSTQKQNKRFNPTAFFLLLTGMVVFIFLLHNHSIFVLLNKFWGINKLHHDINYICLFWSIN